MKWGQLLQHFCDMFVINSMDIALMFDMLFSHHKQHFHYDMQQSWDRSPPQPSSVWAQTPKGLWAITVLQPLQMLMPRRLRLRHALLGAGSAQAGSTGAAGQDGSGGGGGGLVRASVLEQNIDAAFAPCFPGDHHGCLALVVFCLHIDPILQGGGDTNQIFHPICRLSITTQGETCGG